MPAKALLRKHEEGIYCHIYNRGVENKPIFNDDEDYNVFLSYLSDYLSTPKNPASTKKDFTVKGRQFQGIPHQPKNYVDQVELVSYSLRPDHFHLVLHQTAAGSLEKFIRSLCTRYSIYFNKKTNHTGSVFAGAYKSVPVGAGAPLLELTRHLHSGHGPSSFPEYAGKRDTHWVKPQIALKSFAGLNGTYEEFVQQYQQGDNLLIEVLTLDSKQDHLVRNLLSSELPPSVNVVHPATNVVTKSRSFAPHFFVVSTAVFISLTGIGFQNVKLAEARSTKLLNNPQVLSKEVKLTEEPQPTQEPTPLKTPPTYSQPALVQIIKINRGVSKLNVRQKPTTTTPIIGKTKAGDSFEVLASEAGWYKIKLRDNSIGYIPVKYATVEETTSP